MSAVLRRNDSCSKILYNQGRTEKATFTCKFIHHHLVAKTEMRLCIKWTVTLLVAVTACSVKLEAQQVSFTGKSVQLASFFSSVSRQTGYFFFYNATLIDHLPPVPVHLKKMSLDSALHVVLKNQPLTYTIQGKTVFITAAKMTSPESAIVQGSVLHKLQGRVMDHSGIPVMGASVYGIDSKNSTITDSNGNFQIKSKKDESLLISCIGYGKTILTPDSSYVLVVLLNNSSPLEEVIVGGNLFGTKKKSDISSVTVIDSKTLETLPVTNIGEIFRGLVPGTNSYSTGDQTQGTPTLTIRGAARENSISQISVVIDGVEMAGGSAYLSTLNKENIERIEVLRGPESSTLYGTGSNGGIVQIYTKKGIPNENSLFATISAGYIQTKWMNAAAFQQYYTLDKNLSFKNLSLLAGGTFQTNQAWLPGGGEKTGTAHVNMKWQPMQKISIDVAGYYSGTQRYVSRNPCYDTCLHIPDSLQGYGIGPTQLTNKKGTITNYFAGLNLEYLASARWTHRLTLGFSENNIHQSSIASIDTSGMVPDNFNQINNKTLTLRYSNLLKIVNPEKNWSASLMSGADYKNIFNFAYVTGSNPYIKNNDPSNTNWGIFAQINASYKNVYLTTGLRYDYNKLFGNNHSLNPRIGITTNFSVSGIIIKPRISWGSGITAPAYSDRYGSAPDNSNMGAPNPGIKPQQQSGFDYAVEIYDRQNVFSGEIIYYNNTLKNMFITGGLPPLTGGINVYQVTNLGLVANRGWEFSGRYRLGRHFSLNGSFSIMHSVIKDSTGDYTSSVLGGKPPGYQLKNLPLHTAGLFANFRFFKLFRKKDQGSLSLNFTEVDGVYAFNGVQYLIDVAYGRCPANVDPPMRYWQTSATIFKLGFDLEYALSGGLRFFAQGSNVLNQNDYEQNSNFPTHGATWLFGFKFSFSN